MSGEGCPELVAHVRKEGGLGPVEFGQGFGAPSLLFVSLSVRDGGPDVPSHEIEERSVGRVIGPTGTHAHNEDPRRSFKGRARDR